ncbi:hypothetical protein DFH06DRAFT_544792 [Mycena polygramma]|nr:hypothetical protein DFH06DRAFT_544792 [Mycena polygramma]
MLPGLEADRVRVSELQAQIVQLELSVSALRNEKARVQERLDAYKYPVLTLPNEIISEIFIHFLPDYRFPPLTGTLSPTLLTQICRRWHEIALATPALWREVGSFNEGIALDCEMQADIFNIWLARSRSCPVSIEIGKAALNVDFGKVLATVVPHRARWELLELLLLPGQLRAIEGPMPLLQELDLRLIGSTLDPSLEVFTFRQEPVLHTVTLNDVAALTVVLPWAQLTSLTLDTLFPHECVPILQQSTNIVSCTLHVFDSSDEQPGPHITLLRLKSLVFTDLQLERASNFHESFIAPALCSLDIPERHLGADPVNSLQVFISKSGCKLENLCITGAEWMSEHTFRTASPTIRNIDIRYNPRWI